MNKYSKYCMLIITFLAITTNSMVSRALVKMLDSSNVPDGVFFFDEAQEKYSLDKFEGKTILLVFWATWCASCVKEMPDLDILQKDFRKLPFEIIPVSQDYQGVEVVQKYYKNYDISYLPLYHDFKNQLFKAFGVVGLPTAILINPDGKMLVSFVGSINWYDEEIRQVILSNIPGNHLEPKNSYQEQSLNQPVRNLKSPQPPAKKEEEQILEEQTEDNQEMQDSKEPAGAKALGEKRDDKRDNNTKEKSREQIKEDKNGTKGSQKDQKGQKAKNKELNQ